MNSLNDDRPNGVLASFVAWLLIVVCAIYVISQFRPASYDGPFDFNQFGKIPIVSGGRIKPLDSEARVSLLIIREKQTAYIDGKKLPAIQWLTDVLTRPDIANKQPVFRIDHPSIKTLLQVDENEKYFSYEQILRHRDELSMQINEASKIESKQRDPYQSNIIALAEKLMVYNHLAGQRDLLIVPPSVEGDNWQTLGQADVIARQTGQVPEMAGKFFEILQAYATGDAKHFNHAVAGYHAMLDLDARKTGLPLGMVRFEAVFNHVSPFSIAMTLYVIVFVLSVLSWLFWRKPLGRATLGIMAIALIVHSFGIIARMYIQGRPPVTNLYSSAIFVGWAAVTLALVLEYFYRKNIGGVIAGVIGFTTLILAHHLGVSGDTMQSMQAVLDSNFWLATHVVTISIGYMATYVAGLLGIVYVLRGLFTSSLDKDNAKSLTRMAYGTICFALLFSFVGTILGGIWADQSWGRFWGWDPKENGALMIVLWNALILHARWGGLVKQRGFMLMAIFGNIVTTWSWFGTNLLGVGLHSYGFMDGAKFWMNVFNLSQLVLITWGLLPLRYWRNYYEEPESITLGYTIFSLEGRISRSDYWLKGFLPILPVNTFIFPLAIPLYLAIVYIYKIPYQYKDIVFFITSYICLVSILPSWSIFIKRWQDRNHLGWWIYAPILLFTSGIALITFIRLNDINQLSWWVLSFIILFGGYIVWTWFAIELWFLKGTEGTNRFGEDPLKLHSSSNPDFAYNYEQKH